MRGKEIEGRREGGSWKRTTKKLLDFYKWD